MSAVDAGGVTTRDPDLILARLHLRLGSLALARAELETLAGRDALDDDQAAQQVQAAADTFAALREHLREVDEQREHNES